MLLSEVRGISIQLICPLQCIPKRGGIDFYIWWTDSDSRSRVVGYISCGSLLCPRTTITMSDLFYPAIITGNKYYAAILTYIPLLRYTISAPANDRTAVLYSAMPPSSPATVRCRFPRHYLPHLERFLWRYYLFFGLYDEFHIKRKVMNAIGVGIMERMLVMLDTVLEQLVLTCEALGDDVDPDTRVPYFDAYLVTEFIVGRHDPRSVDAWRENPDHTDLDLERIGPHELGK
jgi:hypothetical protein